MKINIQVVSFLTHFRCNISSIVGGRDLEEMLNFFVPSGFSGVWSVDLCCMWLVVLYHLLFCYWQYTPPHSIFSSFGCLLLVCPPPTLLTKNDKVPPVNHPLEEGLARGAASLRSASKGGPSSLGWLTGGT